MKKVAILAFLLTSTSAYAVDFSQKIVASDGTSVCVLDVTPPEVCPADKYFTLLTAARNALYATFEDEKNLQGEEKYRRAELAQAISVGGDVKLKAEDTALLKKLIGKAYTPLVVLQTWNLLEGKPAIAGKQ